MGRAVLEIVEAISIPAVLVDGNARIAATNAAARQILGDRLEGRHYITALRQPPLLEAIETANETGKAARARTICRPMPAAMWHTTRS